MTDKNIYVRVTILALPGSGHTIAQVTTKTNYDKRTLLMAQRLRLA